MTLAEYPRSGEIPTNLQILIVDDYPDVSDFYKNACQKAFQNIAGTNIQTVTNGWDSLFRSILIDLKPDIIFLDHSYSNNKDTWKINQDGEGKLEQIANEVGINLESIKRQNINSQDRDWDITMPQDLYDRPNSINFALLLRYLGYKGKIVTFSGDPPFPLEITKSVNVLNDHLHKSGVKIQKPIDAILHKQNDRYPHDFIYEIPIQKSKSSEWVRKEVTSQDFSVAFTQIMNDLFN